MNPNAILLFHYSLCNKAAIQIVDFCFVVLIDVNFANFYMPIREELYYGMIQCYHSRLVVRALS